MPSVMLSLLPILLFGFAIACTHPTPRADSQTEVEVEGPPTFLIAITTAEMSMACPTDSPEPTLVDAPAPVEANWLEQTLEEHQEAIDQCMMVGQVSTTVSVELIIERSGNVSTAQVITADYVEDGAAQCLSELFLAIRFPALCPFGPPTEAVVALSPVE